MGENYRGIYGYLLLLSCKSEYNDFRHDFWNKMLYISGYKYIYKSLFKCLHKITRSTEVEISTDANRRSVVK